jgi:flagellar biosynthesis/type III secretory pathway M-ring protein FliF/YscJ
VVCVSENLNKQLRNLSGEMNSSGAKTLEAIIKQEEEIQVAIESLLETPVGDDVEAVSPVIEQQLDPESYENTSYSIEAADYDSASYDTGKNYYELVMGGDDDKPIGASMTAVYSEYYHELLQDVQQIAANTRAGDESRHTYVEPHVDFATREKKDSVKLVSVAVWQAMYDGKLRFN